MKDKQFIEKMVEYAENEMTGVYFGKDAYGSPNYIDESQRDHVLGIINTIIKRSFAHRDEHWREGIKRLPFSTVARQNGEPKIVVWLEDLKALFTNKETKE